MYPTEMSRKTFFAFLGNLQKTVENKKDVDSVHMDYLGEHSDKEKNVKGSGLRNDASILRTVLLKDIGTRKEPHLDFGNKISRFKIKEDLKINGITIKETTSPEVPSNKTGHP